jgi:anti-sigma factor (TIGR02949 family)
MTDHRVVPIDCEHVMRVLQQYLDGVLETPDTERVAAHLEDCRHCGLEADTYERLRRSLARGGEVPGEVVARVRALAEQLARGGGP